MRGGEALHEVRMMRPVGQGVACRLCCFALRLCLGQILLGCGHSVAKRGLCRFQLRQRIFGLIDGAQCLPQLPLSHHTRRRSRPDRVLRSFNLVRDLQQALRLCIQCALRRRDEQIEFRKAVGADQLLCDGRAITISRKAIPAPQFSGQRYHAFAGGQRFAIVRFHDTNH